MCRQRIDSVLIAVLGSLYAFFAPVGACCEPRSEDENSVLRAETDRRRVDLAVDDKRDSVKAWFTKDEKTRTRKRATLADLGGNALLRASPILHQVHKHLVAEGGGELVIYSPSELCAPDQKYLRGVAAAMSAIESLKESPYPSRKIELLNWRRDLAISGIAVDFADQLVAGTRRPWKPGEMVIAPDAKLHRFIPDSEIGRDVYKDIELAPSAPFRHDEMDLRWIVALRRPPDTTDLGFSSRVSGMQYEVESVKFSRTKSAVEEITVKDGGGKSRVLTPDDSPELLILPYYWHYATNDVGAPFLVPASFLYDRDFLQRASFGDDKKVWTQGKIKVAYDAMREAKTLWAEAAGEQAPIAYWFDIREGDRLCSLGDFENAELEYSDALHLYLKPALRLNQLAEFQKDFPLLMLRIGITHLGDGTDPYLDGTDLHLAQVAFVKARTEALAYARRLADADPATAARANQRAFEISTAARELLARTYLRQGETADDDEVARTKYGTANDEVLFLHGDLQAHNTQSSHYLHTEIPDVIRNYLKNQGAGKPIADEFVIREDEDLAQRADKYLVEALEAQSAGDELRASAVRADNYLVESFDVQRLGDQLRAFAVRPGKYLVEEFDSMAKKAFTSAISFSKKAVTLARGPTPTLETLATTADQDCQDAITRRKVVFCPACEIEARSSSGLATIVPQFTLSDTNVLSAIRLSNTTARELFEVAEGNNREILAMSDSKYFELKEHQQPKQPLDYFRRDRFSVNWPQPKEYINWAKDGNAANESSMALAGAYYEAKVWRGLRLTPDGRATPDLASSIRADRKIRGDRLLVTGVEWAMSHRREHLERFDYAIEEYNEARLISGGQLEVTCPAIELKVRTRAAKAGLIVPCMEAASTYRGAIRDAEEIADGDDKYIDLEFDSTTNARVNSVVRDYLRSQPNRAQEKPLESLQWEMRLSGATDLQDRAASLAVSATCSYQDAIDLACPYNKNQGIRSDGGWQLPKVIDAEQPNKEWKVTSTRGGQKAEIDLKVVVRDLESANKKAKDAKDNVDLAKKLEKDKDGIIGFLTEKRFPRQTKYEAIAENTLQASNQTEGDLDKARVDLGDKLKRGLGLYELCYSNFFLRKDDGFAEALEWSALASIHGRPKQTSD